MLQSSRSRIQGKVCLLIWLRLLLREVASILSPLSSYSARAATERSGSHEVHKGGNIRSFIVEQHEQRYSVLLHVLNHAIHDLRYSKVVFPRWTVAATIVFNQHDRGHIAKLHSSNHHYIILWWRIASMPQSNGQILCICICMSLCPAYLSRRITVKIAVEAVYACGDFLLVKMKSFMYKR